MKLRLKFRKYGPVRFIGHLDVMRYFQKTLRRAEIDVAYTSGFSPHQIMSFAAPLSVGLESNGEYMDIKVNSVTSSKDMIHRINSVGVPGIEVTSVKLLPEDAGNAMASVAAALYTVQFREGYKPASPCENNVDAFTQRDHIFITKETKKGTREIDLKPGIYRFTCTEGVYTMLLDASSAGNIKPSQVMEAYLKDQEIEIAPCALSVTREETYMNTGTPEKAVLIPLDGIGEEIPEAGDDKL